MSLGDALAPGEWYLDRVSRRLHYQPRQGEDLTTVEVIAPQLERMVDLNGVAAITFDGLIFEHANWTYPDGEQGYVGCQANVHWDGWRVNPGAMDAARIPWRASSLAHTTAMAVTPALAAE